MRCQLKGLKLEEDKDFWTNPKAKKKRLSWKQWVAIKIKINSIKIFFF